jgi:hypothetical protein
MVLMASAVLLWSGEEYIAKLCGSSGWFIILTKEPSSQTVLKYWALPPMVTLML